MASFTFNALQQKQFFSITLCKYPSSTFSFKSNYFISHVFTISTLRHTLHQELPSVSIARATVRNNMDAKICSREHEHKNSIKTLNSTTQREMDSGFSPLSSRNERVDRKYMKTKVSSVVEEKMERKNRKDSYVRKNIESRRKREMESGFSSLRSRDGRVEIKSKKIKVGPVVDEKMSKYSKNSKGSSHVGEKKMDKNVNKCKGDSQVGKEMDKKSKKTKVDSPEVQWRIGLDMCSKKGDVLGGISLYDSAQREGPELGQYHYTVLLYLCSSAAVGVVRPAKSGSGSRTFHKMESTKEISSVNSVNLSKIRDMGSGNFDGTISLPATCNGFMVESGKNHSPCSDKMGSNSSGLPVELGKQSGNGILNQNEQFNQFPCGFTKEGLKNSLNHKRTDAKPQFSDGFITLGMSEDDSAEVREGNSDQEDCKIQITEDVKRYALMRGFEIYEKMCLEKIPLNEAALTSVARMAMSMGNGDMAFEMVKQMETLSINPRLRSYGPALFTFCNNGDIEKAFEVEEHMLEHGVYPEEPELEALLRLSVGAGRGDKVYYLLHKFRTSVRQVSPPTADLIERWFISKAASRVGKRKWDSRLILEAMENGGGGWHGQGWLGKGNWTIERTSVGTDGVCEGCGDKLTTIDLDPTETENFAKSVASIAAKRERNSSFLRFQKWLDYYGPFEAVVDAANVGLFSQRRFSLSKINAIVNGIRQKHPSKKWPLIVLHNKRIMGGRMDEPANRTLIEKWKTADALYATPTGSNDDWYWLYAAIKFKCLLVTNDEMRDHIFQLLGNDFFPRWKERHQVHFSFCDGGPEFHMPPPCSVVIQESEKGHWHIPVVTKHDSERERTWLCITRAKTTGQDSHTRLKEAHPPRNNKGRASSDVQTKSTTKLSSSDHDNGGKIHQSTQYPQESYRNISNILSTSIFSNYQTLLSKIEAAEKLGGCIIDFQI